LTSDKLIWHIQRQGVRIATSTMCSHWVYRQASLSSHFYWPAHRIWRNYHTLPPSFHNSMYPIQTCQNIIHQQENTRLFFGCHVSYQQSSISTKFITLSVLLRSRQIYHLWRRQTELNLDEKLAREKNENRKDNWPHGHRKRYAACKINNRLTRAGSSCHHYIF
jgi:hypothetical protein